MSSTFHFVKMTGAGNDFVVSDGRECRVADPGELARRLCPRRTSVGADGLMIVTGAKGRRVDIDYRNADGSPAGFCGNGARCAARFVVDAGIVDGSPFVLAFAREEVEGRAGDRDASVLLASPGPPRAVPAPRVLAESGLELWEVQAGVPHLVTMADHHPSATLDLMERGLRSERPRALDDANLTAVRSLGEGRLEVATLERGSGRTLACGSAAVAAAALASRSSGANPWTVVPPSKIALEVEFSERGALLSGEARIVYRGRVEL